MQILPANNWNFIFVIVAASLFVSNILLYLENAHLSKLLTSHSTIQRSLLVANGNRVGARNSRLSPLLNVNGTLMFAHPVSRWKGMNTLQKGLLNVNQSGTVAAFCMDLGIHDGLVITHWLTNRNDIYAIGIDGNPDKTIQLQSKFNDKLTFQQRSLVLNAAIASTTTQQVAQFNLGVGFPGTNQQSDQGSLFGWTDPNWEQTRKNAPSATEVRLLRLDKLLRFIPPPTSTFHWDTLKIDIQGADADALISAGSYLDNFLCIVGEFQTDKYAIPLNIPVDVRPIFAAHQFQRVYEGDNQIWMNVRYKSEFLARPEKFNCHNVYDSPIEVGKLVQAWTENKVWNNFVGKLVAPGEPMYEAPERIPKDADVRNRLVGGKQ